jgi:hypothetical protein
MPECLPTAKKAAAHACGMSYDGHVPISRVILKFAAAGEQVFASQRADEICTFDTWVRAAASKVTTPWRTRS